jgi:hypothetical protein
LDENKYNLAKMTEPRSTTLDELLLGMRIVFFELMWGVFPWIQSIWIRESNGQFQLFVQMTEEQDEKEWDDFEYLVRERIAGAERALDKRETGSKHKIDYIIQHGPAIPRTENYRELMSDRLFRMLAKRHAPWRLEEGRFGARPRKT